MADGNEAQVTAIYRYPVKGLSADPLQTVECTAGEALPYDRAYAIESGSGKFDPEAPRHLPKVNFLMLMRDERLATLATEFDETDEALTILRAGKQVARAKLNDPMGRKIIEQFLSAYMNFALRGAPKIVHAPGHSFSDVPSKCLHIVNMASVRDLERITRRTIDPLRFRANIYFDNGEPWSEFGWLDQDLVIGNCKVSVFTRTQRCEATDVNPSKGVRDMTIPLTLSRNLGHSDFGIYARITGDGRISVGDTVSTA